MTSPRSGPLPASDDRKEQSGQALPSPGRRRDVRWWLGAAQEYGVYVFLVLLVLYDLTVTQGFDSAAAFRSLLIAAAPLVLVAVGEALAIGTQGIDLSVGSNMALASAVLPLALGVTISNPLEQRSAALAIAAAVGATLLAGLISGLVIAYLDVNPLIVTLGMQLVVRGVAESLTSGNQIQLTDGTLGRLATGQVLGIPLMAIVFVVAGLAAALLIRYTVFGRRLVAIGGNRRASFISGIPTRRVILVVYAMSGLLAGVAGVLASAYLSSSDPGDIGQLYELLAIAAVVIGGTPLTGGRVTIAGTVAGALILQLLSTTFVSHDLQPTTATMVEAVLIVVAVYFQRRRGN
jgi:ribose/xylose/arabinose/galactoside ABC-type transport system permease subunit